MKTVRVVGGSWNMTDVKFYNTCTIPEWTCVVICFGTVANRYAKEYPGPIVDEFVTVLNQRGMKVSKPNSFTKVENADQLKGHMIKRSGDKFMLVILPNANSTTYTEVKFLGDVTFGIHTVCITGEKLAKERGRQQYLNNVALKVNLQLGGTNHIVEPSYLEILRKGKTMVCGVDVTHPSPGSASAAPSISGMVASVDQHVAQWPGILRVQSEARQEMVSDLEDMFRSRLILWRQRNKTLPENIIVYRDGVSEGQYQIVLDEELPLLREACRKMYSSADQKKGLPKFTVIVVTKRHHTRFYPTQVGQADRNSNNKAGTVVDRGVTEVGDWDFFLQSHAAIQGTARSAHYFVLVDEIFRARAKQGAGSAADEVEKVSQGLCSAYGRATKAVSIVAPVYLADVLCERARVYLSRVFEGREGAGEQVVENRSIQPQERIKDSMFYV